MVATMNVRLVDLICEVLISNDPVRIRRYATIVPDLLRRTRNPDHVSGIPEVDSEFVDETDFERLTDAIIHALARRPATDVALSLVFALGFASRPGAVQILRRELAHGLDAFSGANALLGNLLVSLDKLGEKTIGDEEFFLFDYERNVERAKGYLLRIGRGDDQW